MSRAGILISLVVVLAAVAGCLFYIRHGEILQTPEGETSTLGENLFEQSVVTSEITFFYSKEFSLAIKEEQVLQTSYIPPCSPGFDYCLYYTGAAYAGTNFDSAGLRIQRRPDLLEQQSCLVTSSEGFENIEPVTFISEGYATSLFPALGDAGAGHSAVGDLYRLSYKDMCYEFETRISASQYANYEPGTIVEFTNIDKTALEAHLQTIIRNILFTDSKERVVFPE